MIVKPKIRGFMCVSAHPVGCEANVREQIDYVKSQGAIAGGLVPLPKNVLVIGASTGYGLAARIAAAFGCGAATLGVFFERPGEETRLGTAGWYNSAAFHKFADQEGLYARSINGDAFTDELKQQTIETIRADLGQVDLVIYSLAAPRRKHPKTGEVFNSTLKPIGAPLTKRGIDTDRNVLKDITLPAATQDDIDQTVAVMGGEDWQMWIEALDAGGVLAPGAKTAAFTYLGERVTRDIYWNGTIGAAKKDLDKKVLEIRARLARTGGDARVAVLKAVVTQASSAIPVMPLYLSALFKIMKEDGSHQGCIEQLYQLFSHDLYGPAPTLDADGRLRTDYAELRPEVQDLVQQRWDVVTNETLDELTDYVGYKHEFLRLFGFDIAGVDYDAEVDPVVPIKGVVAA